jgi:hypothetical protein
MPTQISVQETLTVKGIGIIRRSDRVLTLGVRSQGRLPEQVLGYLLPNSRFRDCTGSLPREIPVAQV